MLGIKDAASVRIICVLLVIGAVIPFRAAPRCLQIVQPSAPWVPHFTSVINWTMRVGLAMLSGVQPIPEPWIAMIDMSIDVAIKKVFVVLRVPLTALALRGSAISLQDCEVVGLKVSETWTGMDVDAALHDVFSKVGQPVAIVKDGGKDLKRGVELYRERPGAASVKVIADVGHVAANALKAEFAELDTFKAFLKGITKGAAKLRQSKIAFLTPPKIRTKGRFLGITRLAEWAEKVSPLLGGAGRVAEGTLASDLRRLLGGLGQYRPVIERFVLNARVVGKFVEIAKNKGVNQESYRAMKAELAALSERSPVRIRLESWLGTHLHIQSRLGIGQTPLLVSSDPLESLFGKFKNMVARNPKAEFNRIVLAIPPLCGTLTEARIASALQSTKQSTLDQWTTDHVEATQWQQRAAFHRGELTPETVPKTGNIR